MSNMVVDAALKQVERDVQRAQIAIESSTGARKERSIKQAVASVDTLKAALKSV